MRVLGALVVSVALLLAGWSPATATAPAETCRQQWAHLAQVHGDRGNPGGSGATRPLQRRWDRYQRAAERLGRKATASDCRKIGGFEAAWAGLERLLRAMHPHDYLFRLRLANVALRHFRDSLGHNPGRPVMRAFAFLRPQARHAAGDLAPVVEAARAITTSSPEQVTGYLRDYRAAARASTHAVKAKGWARIIKKADLVERAANRR